MTESKVLALATLIWV